MLDEDTIAMYEANAENHSENKSHFVIGYIVGCLPLALIIAAAVACLFLSGCASLQQPPRQYSEIQHDVKQRIVYKNYAAKDYRYIPHGDVSEGNCATFAFTAMLELTKIGTNPQIKLCRIVGTGEGHAYTYTPDGWAFDVRFKDVTKVESVDCE